jgi:hypothetical protein
VSNSAAPLQRTTARLSVLRRGLSLLATAGLLSVGFAAASPFGNASPAFAADASPGTFTISASAQSIAPGDHAFISVHRSGGADGIVSVSVDSATLPVELASVIAPIDAEVTFLAGDTAAKTVPIVFLGEQQPGHLPTVPDVPGDGDLPGDVGLPGVDTPDGVIDVPGAGGGSARAATAVSVPHARARVIAAAPKVSAPLTVSLSAPTGGALLGTPSSVTISVATPPTTTPVDGGSGAGPTGSTPGGPVAPGGTTIPGGTTKNSTGTTTPVGGGRSLADTGVDVIMPFTVATFAAILGLAVMMFARRRHS